MMNVSGIDLIQKQLAVVGIVAPTRKYFIMMWKLNFIDGDGQPTEWLCKEFIKEEKA